MSDNIIQRLIQEVFGGGGTTKEHRVLFLGLDASGRTTALYHLLLGEVVTTIPTIGFNVETIPCEGVNFKVWDVGGCDKIKPLWRHYFADTDVFFFFVDSNDRDRHESAKKELYRLLAEPALYGVPFCVVANKQDLQNAASTAELVDVFEMHDRVAGGECCVLPATSITGQGLSEMMEWAHEVVTTKEKTKPKEKEETPDSASEEDIMAKKVEETLLDWLSRKDGDDDEFLQQLEECTLDNWDHRTHLRIAWLLLSRHGRREGLAKIFAGIRHFIDNSHRTFRSRGTTFHETMTYFWTHMVHYAMVTTANPRKDFNTFLLLNPQLANGGLFLHYYSKKLMLQTADSRLQVVLPDIRPLPSLVTDVETLSNDGGGEVDKLALRAAPLSDEEFRTRWQEGRLDSWGHESRLRAIWLCLKQNVRREGVQKAFEGLEATEKTGHHVTATYFWIQMTDYVMHKLDGGEESSPPTFGIFIQKPAAQMLRNPDLISKYYSKSILGVLGKKEFNIPDLKPMPSVV